MRAALLENASYQCPYLSGRQVKMEQFLTFSLDPEEHEQLLQRGYRHFGSYYFRPSCIACARCVPLRFKPLSAGSHRSWRRVLNKGAGLQVRLDGEVDQEEAFELYRRHKTRFDDGEKPDPRLFRESFFSSHPAEHRLSIRDGDRLVGVTHFDWTPNALSAIYTYYNDREYRSLSLGKLAILRLAELARERGIESLYLGFYVHGNRAMSYKADFTPFEFSPFAGHWTEPLQSLEELRFYPGESLREEL